MSTDAGQTLSPQFAQQIITLAQSVGCTPDGLDALLLNARESNAALVGMWSDEAVIAAADMQWPDPLQERQSELLYQQQARSLTPDEQSELSNLMEIYKAAQFHKARGMVESVRRGLRKPPVF